LSIKTAIYSYAIPSVIMSRIPVIFIGHELPINAMSLNIYDRLSLGMV